MSTLKTYNFTVSIHTVASPTDAETMLQRAINSRSLDNSMIKIVGLAPTVGTDTPNPDNPPPAEGITVCTTKGQKITFEKGFCVDQDDQGFWVIDNNKQTLACFTTLDYWIKE